MAARKRKDTTHDDGSEANVLRIHNSLLGFRRQCGAPACKRKRRCAGDAKACFDRFWPPLPERVKVEYRGFITALRNGRTADEALIDAQAEAARYDALRETVDELAASPLAPRSGERVPSECEAGEGQASAKPLTRHPRADALGRHPLPASQGEGKERKPRLRSL